MPALIVNDVFRERLGHPALSSHPTVQIVTGAVNVTGVSTAVTPSQGESGLEPSAIMLTDP